MTESPETTEPRRRPSPTPHSWWVRARLPMRTVVPLAVFAALLWLNAIVNPFRFNVALALLASVPLLIVVARRAVIARAERPGQNPIGKPA